jgi:hypothetical protein
MQVIHWSKFELANQVCDIFNWFAKPIVLYLKKKILETAISQV